MQEGFDARCNLEWPTRMRRFDQTRATALLKAMQPIAYSVIALANDFCNLINGVALTRKQDHLNPQSCPRTTRLLVHGA